jgi:hypothetical protein
VRLGSSKRRSRHFGSWWLTEARQSLHLEALFVVATWLLVLALVANVAGRVMVRSGGTVRR